MGKVDANQFGMFLNIKKTDITNEIREHDGLSDSENSSHDRPLQRKPLFITESDRQVAVELGLIPLAHRDNLFDEEKIKNSIRLNILKNSYKVLRYATYSRLLGRILATIRLGQVPSQSYLIGSPNGFGKTHFATEAIISMNKLGWRTVPFTSLTELAELCAANERRLMQALYNGDVTFNDAAEYSSSPSVKYTKKPKLIVGRYSWSEYINADCLFCYFTAVESRQIESRMLYRIVRERAVKGLPTIAFISTSLEPYLQDRALKEYVWDELLLDSTTKFETVERLKHISCFKKPKDPFERVRATEEDGDINDFNYEELLAQERAYENQSGS